MVTVSWQPGALKGYSVAETSQFIFQAMQWWQTLCGVRFGTLPFGNRTDITIYPYSGNMNGAFMGAYVETGQIIYTTRTEAERPFCVTAFAHEIGHCFRLGHVDREGALMYWRGSVDRYFDTIEARAAWGRFGRFTGWHWPYSLRYRGDQIREWQAKHKIATEEWRRFQRLRDNETNKTKRAAYDNQCRLWLNRKRQSHTELAKVNARWLTLKNDWERIGGIRVPTASRIEAPDKMAAIQADDVPEASGICECFKPEPIPGIDLSRENVDLRKVFNELKEEAQRKAS